MKEDTMFLESIKSDGLAHLSYIIGSNGKAAVIDPRRDCKVYVDIARRNGAVISYIFETHRNEDYTIGSCELAALTGAEILHGAQLDFGYGSAVRDGDVYSIGKLQLKILETPGHTYESISIAVIDTDFGEHPVGVFTGDTLFIGDVGRTDFFPDRKEETATLLYESIFNKLLPLGDQVLIYPAHGAGSVCGSGMAAREFSTLGYERSYNPALQLDRQDFIQKKISERHYIAPYFRQMEKNNRHGAALLKQLPAPEPCSADHIAREIDCSQMQVLDTRSPEAIAGTYISGSIPIPLDMVPVFAGWFCAYDRPIGLVTDRYEDVEQAVRYLVRIGYDCIPVFLHGGMHAWETSGRLYDTIPALHVEALKQRLDSKEDFTLLDVRSADEFDSGHIPDALHIYVGQILEQCERIPRDKPVVTFCNSGKRAVIASGLLKNEGFSDVGVCFGSMLACEVAGCPLTEENAG